MSQGALAKHMEEILKAVEKRTEFREKISNRKVHVFNISVKDVKEQCMAEITARLQADKIALGTTTTKRGKKKKVAGGLGKGFSTDHPLYKELKAVVDDEVPKFVGKMYDILFKGNVKSKTGDVIKLSGIDIGMRGEGDRTGFKAVLSPAKGTPEIFKQFKVKVKQEAQDKLYKALQKVIDTYNVSNPAANIKGLTGKGQSFLELGHDTGSAVITQRQQRVSDMFFEFDTSTDDPAIKSMVAEFGAEYLGAILKKDTKEITELSVSFESKEENKDTVAKGEAGKEVLVDMLKEAIEALGAEAYLHLGGSDSRFEIIEKTIVNEFMDNLPKGAKVSRRLPAKINYSSGKEVKTKKRTTKATVFKEKDTVKSRSKSFKKKSGKGVSSMPLELLGILNDKLPETVRRNMIPPALQDQTGRFANSVKVTEIAQTPKGFPSIGYTYDRDNYEQYEITSGSAQWANSDRDPRKLIDASIREIAAQTALGRFFTRRV